SVSAQLLNPCGHTICGPCAEQWLYDKGAETCPNCRRKTNYLRPVIPNIIVDNFVERYIQVCALSGEEAWQTDGVKLTEWLERTK
ncbi:MAG: hypothetical protein NXY57DRAFT_892295, partial [Lentinula lateritia]